MVRIVSVTFYSARHVLARMVAYMLSWCLSRFCPFVRLSQVAMLTAKLTLNAVDNDRHSASSFVTQEALLLQRHFATYLSV